MTGECCKWILKCVPDKVQVDRKNGRKRGSVPWELRARELRRGD